MPREAGGALEGEKEHRLPGLLDLMLAMAHRGPLTYYAQYRLFGQVANRWPQGDPAIPVFFGPETTNLPSVMRRTVLMSRVFRQEGDTALQQALDEALAANPYTGVFLSNLAVFIREIDPELAAEAGRLLRRRLRPPHRPPRVAPLHSAPAARVPAQEGAHRREDDGQGHDHSDRVARVRLLQKPALDAATSVAHGGVSKHTRANAGRGPGQRARQRRGGE